MQLPVHSVSLHRLRLCGRRDSQKQELEHFLQNINKMLKVITKNKRKKRGKKPLLFANMIGMYLTLAFEVVLFAIFA